MFLLGKPQLSRENGVWKLGEKKVTCNIGSECVCVGRRKWQAFKRYMLVKDFGSVNRE